MDLHLAAAPPARKLLLSAGLGLPTALASAALMLLAALPLLQGKPMLGDDNDSMLRLVEVRDLLAGQGWFDLTQYRMGLADGFEMHWSRLIDAPLAALILVGQAAGLTASAAETVALLVWPALLAAAALHLIMRIARMAAGEDAMLPAGALGVAALFYSGQFRPGSIDHHSAQAVLALAVVHALVSRPGRANGAIAGLAAALMAGIGIETQLHIVLAALGAALVFALEGPVARGFAIAFGLTFAAGLAAILFGFVAPDRHWQTACDAFSIAQAAPGVAGGLALAAAAAFTPANVSRLFRFGALAAAGAAAALFSGRYALPCLADPLAGFDPLVRRYWLDLVDEARPLLAVALARPGIGLSYAMPPLIALAFIAWRVIAGQAARPLLVLGLAVAGAFAIALMQVRGGVLAMILAAAPLAAFVAAARARVARDPAWPNQLAMVAAWSLSMNIVWAVFGLAIDPATWRTLSEEKPAAGERPVECTEAAAYGALRAQAPGTVLAISNLGSAILLNTGHRAVAGPYHRNIAGMRAAITAFIAPADKAEVAVRATAATIVAACPDDAESRFYLAAEPASFAAALARGEAPAWLEPLGPADAPLRLYRVRPPG